jgi:hypothetical protein
LEAARQAALENEAHQAWRHATQYEIFGMPLSNSKECPKRNDTLSSRDVWVKAFQHSDVRSLGKSPKYGNAAYQLSTVVALHDTMSSGMVDILVRRRAPDNVFHAAVQGEWSSLTMQCKVEQLDGGEWFASEYKFTKLAAKPDFIFERVKGED